MPSLNLNKQIVDLTPAIGRSLASNFAQMGQLEPIAQFEKYIEEAASGVRTNLVLCQKEQALGYITIVWDSPHPDFALQKIPEMKDLNVLPDYRKHGIGTLLLNAAEQCISERAMYAGMYVAITKYDELYPFYHKRGYCPFGEPSWYTMTLEYPGMAKPDPCLVQWFIKKLHN